MSSSISQAPRATGTFVLFSLSFLLWSGPPHAAPAEQTPQFRWPVETGAPPEVRGLTSTFGESRGDHFHNGLDIAAANKSVRSIAGGRILFSRSGADTPFEQAPGPGNVVILEHENGWRSGYFHLSRLAKRHAGPIEPGTVLGMVGNTGRSRGIHLHFFVSDPKGRYLNPLLVLPVASDPNPPLIGMAAVFTENKTALLSPIQEENIRLSKAFPMGVTIIDPGLEKGTRRGIYELSWQLNDGPVKKRRFDSLSFNFESLKLHGEESFEEVFRDGHYLLGTMDLAQGANVLKVSAKDLTGNESSRTYHINVDRRR